ncbi:C6 zinc finger protein [Colletotrichum orchidophilum]|uniref:C6 zinc finger protein n=1 Tax=Colletotrichum orchidophilum TaxID=1209926 RepID=A0A1G4ARB5_9PEZI|nr:C6 zinc finger protein [Colletotrichum orchidophilum]OHE91708.1 C6 zinc finger protein [Colletotrichum orchidophilum]
MAKIGTQRVKTGCTTCKIRRIKCDEARPSCARCISTGRKCDGYVLPPTTTYSWAQLLRSCPLQNTSSIRAAQPSKASRVHAERAMDYYRKVTAPQFSGSLNSYFWSNVVVQMSDQEPVASHAVLALSSIYETFRQGSHEASSFAVWHYNEAIKLLRTTTDRALILFVCILFICIELLRRNPKDAIAHCRHGINILNEIHNESDFLRNHITPVIRQLSVAPYHYGVNPATFPTVRKPLPTATQRLQNVAEAHARLLTIHVRLARYVESVNERRLETGQEGPEPGARWTGQFIQVDLDAWYKAYRELKKEERYTSREEEMMRLLDIRYLVTKITLLTSYNSGQGECANDEHIDKFRAIVVLASQAEDSSESSPKSTSSSTSSSKSSAGWATDSALELGYSSLLFVVAAKCRRLKLRLEALRLMKKLMVPSRNIWEKALTWRIAQRVIELEHEITLDDETDLDALVSADEGEFVPEERRVINIEFRWPPDTTIPPRRSVMFFTRDGVTGETKAREEFLIAQ